MRSDEVVPLPQWAALKGSRRLYQRHFPAARVRAPRRLGAETSQGDGDIAVRHQGVIGSAES